MWRPPINDQYVEEIFLAGERVPEGTYRQVGTRRVVTLANGGTLPASLDGHVACYCRVGRTWGEMDDGAATPATPRRAH